MLRNVNLKLVPFKVSNSNYSAGKRDRGKLYTHITMKREILPHTYQNLKTLFLPKFSISNFHIGVRARGVAAWQILPAWRRLAAACIPVPDVICIITIF